MDHITEVVKGFIKQSKQIKKAYPNVFDLTFTVKDVPVDELRELAKKRKGQFYYAESQGRMCVQLTHASSDPFLTVFCYSTPVKVEQHYVVDSAMVNV